MPLPPKRNMLVEMKKIKIRAGVYKVIEGDGAFIIENNTPHPMRPDWVITDSSGNTLHCRSLYDCISHLQSIGVDVQH